MDAIRGVSFFKEPEIGVWLRIRAAQQPQASFSIRFSIEVHDENTNAALGSMQA